MCGKWRIYEWGFCKDFLKTDRAGRRVGSRGKEDDGKSLPKWHWPQKATTAQAATAASKGKLILRPLMSCWSILELTGGWGGCLDLPGARLWTLLRTYRRQALPFHSRLWVICHALSTERWLKGVVLACFPRLEAANAQSTNSLLIFTKVQ